jgi:hypothetical protein
VLGRTYLVMYTDGRGQAQIERGRLVSLDQEGKARTYRHATLRRIAQRAPSRSAMTTEGSSDRAIRAIIKPNTRHLR